MARSICKYIGCLPGFLRRITYIIIHDIPIRFTGSPLQRAGIFPIRRNPPHMPAERVLMVAPRKNGDLVPVIDQALDQSFAKKRVPPKTNILAIAYSSHTI